MIEEPYSSLDASRDGRFMHSASSITFSSSSSSSYSSPASPSSTSPSSFADSPTVLNKSLALSERSGYSISSSNLSYSPPSTAISAASSCTSVGLTSPGNAFPAEWNDESYNFSAKCSWPIGTNVGIVTSHLSQLQTQAQVAPPLPRDQLQNPRRTSRLLERKLSSGTCQETQTCVLPPPSLVRQADRKVNFVDNLVDTSAQIVEAIWPSSVINKSTEPSLGRVLPLRTFIQETLRRSRSSYSTLQVALYYIFVIRPFIPIEDASQLSADLPSGVRALHCGRRMFLAALILASKYLQDRNYSARAWSKISGLHISEINSNEIAFLSAVNWRLHISDCIFDKWTKIVLKVTPTTSVLNAKTAFDNRCLQNNRWVRILSKLDKTLDLAELDALIDEEARLTIQNLTPVRNHPAYAASQSSDYFTTPAASWKCTENGAKLGSMALALSGPYVSCTKPVDSLPRGCPYLDDRQNVRNNRKSSLSLCETVNPIVTDTYPSFDSTCSASSTVPVSSMGTPVSGIKHRSSKPCGMLRRDTVVPPTCVLVETESVPAREQILGISDRSGNSRPESRRFISAPCTVSISTGVENVGKTRKRGNETPVTARQQKKQKDKLSELASQKVGNMPASGLTPQMRQMNTNFSLASKKGNGLRMNVTPSLPTINGQTMRPGTGQRSMSHVVYG